jgi:tight adherence protein B
MSSIIIIIAAFIGVAALVGGVAIFLRGDARGGVEDRLDILTGAVAPGAKSDGRAQSVLAEPLDNAPGMIEEFFTRFGNIRLFIEQADVPLTPTKLFIVCGGLAAAGVAVVLAAQLPWFLAPLAGIALGFLPFGFLFFKRSKRLAAFAKQLPEALELIARALRAGHSLVAGFQLVGEEMKDPIGKEFRQVYDEQNLGISLEESLQNMAERVPNLDLRFFATAVILQRQTGGDLAEILDKIGHLIRERFKIWGQIQALTGEGRLSGIVLLALPPVLFVTMYRLNPQYVMMLFTDPLGKQMLAVAVVLQILGALLIRKIVNIKV